jgi:hypothetical protein
VALQLMQAGYNRVSVVRGGFQALMQSGVSVAPKDVTPALSPAPSPQEEARPSLTPV